MKRTMIIALAAVMMLGLTACGRKKQPATVPTTLPTEMPTTMTIPIPETNIPDPDINTDFTDYTDPMDGTTEVPMNRRR